MGAAVQLEIDQASLARLHKKLQVDYLIDVPAETFYDGVATVIGQTAKTKAPVDRGDVKSGIKVIKNRNGRSVVASAQHSIYVHEGTKPHWPPVSALRGWAERHGMDPFLVARSISIKGTKAVPFLKDAADETFSRLQPGLTAFSRAVEKRWGA